MVCCPPNPVTTVLTAHSCYDASKTTSGMYRVQFWSGHYSSLVGVVRGWRLLNGMSWRAISEEVACLAGGERGCEICGAGIRGCMFYILYDEDAETRSLSILLEWCQANSLSLRINSLGARELLPSLSIDVPSRQIPRALVIPFDAMITSSRGPVVNIGQKCVSTSEYNIARYHVS